MVDSNRATCLAWLIYSFSVSYWSKYHLSETALRPTIKLLRLAGCEREVNFGSVPNVQTILVWKR